MHKVYFIFIKNLIFCKCYFFFNVLSFFQFKFDCDFKILYNIFFTNYRYISFLMLNFNDMGLILFCNSFLDGYTTTKMHVWTKWKSSWQEKNHPFRRQCHHYQTPVTLTHSNEIHLATQWSEWKSIVTQLKGYWDPMETLSLEKKLSCFIYIWAATCGKRWSNFMGITFEYY